MEGFNFLHLQTDTAETSQELSHGKIVTNFSNTGTGISGMGGESGISPGSFEAGENRNFEIGGKKGGAILTNEMTTHRKSQSSQKAGDTRVSGHGAELTGRPVLCLSAVRDKEWRIRK